MNMKRTNYEKPSTKVIKLWQQIPLLSNSEVMSGEISGYGKNSKGGFTQDEED
jgi:hypothetical protein